MERSGPFAVTCIARKEVELADGGCGALLKSPEFGGQPVLVALFGVLFEVLLFERRRTQNAHLHAGQPFVVLQARWRAVLQKARRLLAHLPQVANGVGVTGIVARELLDGDGSLVGATPERGRVDQRD